MSQDDLEAVKGMLKAGTSMADAKLGGYSLRQLYCYRDDPACLPNHAVAEPGEPVAEPVEPAAKGVEGVDWHWEEGEKEEPQEVDTEIDEDEEVPNVVDAEIDENDEEEALRLIDEASLWDSE